MAVFFWYGYRARIHIGICTVINAFWHVSMSVKKYIAVFKRRQMLFIEYMTVSNEHDTIAERHECVIGKNREVEHHLIDLCLTVTAHAKDLFLQLIEHFDDFLRCVILRQIIARP